MIMKISFILSAVLSYCILMFDVDITFANQVDFEKDVDRKLKEIYDQEICYAPPRYYEDDGFGGAYKLLLESRKSPEGFKKALETFGLAMMKARASIEPSYKREVFGPDRSENIYYHFYFQDTDHQIHSNLSINSYDNEFKKLKITKETRLLFVIPGWRSSLERSEQTKDIYLREAETILKNQSKYKLCVVVVDWRDISMDIDYYRISGSRIDNVGVDMQKIVNKIRANHPDADFNGYKTNCIGHSLGAQICGSYGKQQNGRVHSLLGLDPAGVWFDRVEESRRINKKHAKSVLVIHSDLALLGTAKLGEAHSDIILNNCLMNSSSSTHSEAFNIIATDHGNCELVAHRCPAYSVMYTGGCGHCDRSNRDCIGIGPKGFLNSLSVNAKPRLSSDNHDDDEQSKTQKSTKKNHKLHKREGFREVLFRRSQNRNICRLQYQRSGNYAFKNYFLLTQQDASNCVHMYRVIIHMSQPLRGNVGYQLEAQIDGSQEVISSKAGTLKLRSGSFTVYPEVDGKPDKLVKPDAKDSVYYDLAIIDSGPNGPDQKKLPVKVNQISLRNLNLHNCKIRGVYVQYMSSSSYSTRLKYSSHLTYHKSNCQKSGNLRVIQIK